MTATRRAATIAVLSAGWLVAAALLWRTSVPAGLELPEVDGKALFPAEQVDRAERYQQFLRWNSLARTVAQLGVAVALVFGAPAIVRRLPGGPVVRAVLLVALAYAVLWVARLPFGLASLWWRRRYDVAREGYLDWVIRPWSALLGELLVACGAAAVLVVLARRLGPRWWLAGAGAVAVLGTAYVLLQPLVLAPRFAPLPDGPVRRDVQTLARELGVDGVEVRLRRAAERSRAANAEVVGLGPTRRIVLWDTLLERFSPAEIRAIAAHELAHVSRRHVWKGLGWFLLAVVPAVWLLDLAARRRGGLERPEAVAAVIAAGLALQLAMTPAVSALTRRYEAEADWIALEATRDPAAMRSLFRRLAATNLADPDPPGWWTAVFQTHPPLERRIAMAEAWAERNRIELPPVGMP